MTRFRDLAYSPYFNKHEGVRTLIDYLWSIYPEFTEKRCNRHKVFDILFPDEVHDQAKVAVVFTYAFRLLQRFLELEEGQQHLLNKQLYLLQALRNRQQHTPYEKMLSKAESFLENGALRDSQYFRNKFFLATEADAYFTETQSRKHDQNIQLRQNNLDRFYLAEKLRDACEMHIRSQILKVDYSTRLLEAVLREVEENLATYRSVPAIHIYFLIYKMLTEEKSTHYFLALSTLEEVIIFFEIEEQKTLYNYLQNYCIYQINAGSSSFLEELFKLYKMQLEGNLMIEDGYLSEWHYKNIVTTGLRLEEMDWVFEFIENYKCKLEPDAMDNAYRFNLASYFYATQQFDQVLSLLLQVEYSDLRYSLGAKALLLRTYYDLEETEALFSLCDSFRQYLQRNKLMADNRRIGYFNLFKLTKRAATIRANLGFSSSSKLIRELEKLKVDIDNSTIFNRIWIVQKWKELDHALVSKNQK